MIKDYFFSLLQLYGNPILFVCLAAEYLGLPFVPGEAMMSFVGFLGLKASGPAVLFSIIFAAAGTFTGSMIAWLIAYRYGEAVVLKIGKPIHLTKEKLDKARGSFDRHRRFIIIFSRFVPGVRHVIPYISGLSKIKAGEYALLSLAGAFLWCGSFIGLGSLLGDKWQIIVNLAKTYSLTLLLLVIFIVVTVFFFKNHQKIIFSIAFPLLVFIKISEDILKKELAVFDNSILAFLSRFLSENMTDFMTFLTYLGSGTVMIFIAAIVIIAVRKNKKYAFYGWLIGANLLGGLILNEVYTIIFYRERPNVLNLTDFTGISFLNGQAMTAFCFYGLFAYILWVNVKSRLRYLPVFFLAALILSVGISGIYLGINYASDVLAGFSAGLVWLTVFIVISNRMYKKNREKPTVQNSN